jgi:FkbM family methyltransferase
VYAFEPEPSLFRALQRNCLRNGATNVTTVNRALGSAPGCVAFSRSVFNSGNNHLGTRGWQGQVLEVQVVRLDDALPSHRIDFIKIDVQGYEQQVLAGMDKIFAASPHLTIYFEFWPHGLQAAGTSPAQVLEQLFQRGFRIHRVDNEGLVEITGFPCLQDRLTGQQYTNLLATRAG